MQNQGVILYIFPHIYPFAQPIKQKSHLYGGFFGLYVLQGVEPTKKRASGSSLKLGQSKKIHL